MSWHLTVELGGYWHAGTGRGNGVGADEVVARDGDGLPYLQGSHLRGLWRHAVRLLERLGHAPAVAAPNWTGWADHLFGRASRASGTTEDASDDPVETRFETTEGVVRLGDARLADRALAKALSHPKRSDLRARLVHEVRSTALADDGVVRAQTLRTSEVSVPMRLEARVDLASGARAESEVVLRSALGLITHVGKHRTRGLGRANLTLANRGGARQ